jgi:hypothetical protein
MITRIVLALGLGAFLLSGTAAVAGVDPGDNCQFKKDLGAGKNTFGLLKAFGKNKKTPNPGKLAEDVSKAQSKITKAFTGAEDAGGCVTTGDAGAIELKSEALVDDVLEELNP